MNCHKEPCHCPVAIEMWLGFRLSFLCEVQEGCQDAEDIDPDDRHGPQIPLFLFLLRLSKGVIDGGEV